jgi:hypothetical protein
MKTEISLPFSDCQKPAGALFGARMQVLADGRDGAVAERGLHQTGGRTKLNATVRTAVHPIRLNEKVAKIRAIRNRPSGF